MKQTTFTLAALTVAALTAGCATNNPGFDAMMRACTSGAVFKTLVAPDDMACQNAQAAYMVQEDRYRAAVAARYQAAKDAAK